MKKVAINGFGRIGRLTFRNLVANNRLEVVAINDLTKTEVLAHLLKYDTAHGKFQGTVEHTENSLIINGKSIQVTAIKDPAQLPWGQLGIDVVIESTGLFTDVESLGKHLEAGAKKVALSAPAKGGIKTIVLGVNDHELTSEDTIISNASCTTNCLAPMMKVMHQHFGVKKGFMTTIHAYTSDQRLQDAPHSDLRRARAAGMSMIPTTTGAARAVAEVLPELKGKLDGSAIRVPTPNVSLVDLTFTPSRDTTAEELNAALKAAADGPLRGILGYTDEPNVSIDFNHNANSSTFHMDQTKVMEGTLVRVLSWYDNEWGFSNRMSDTAEAMGKLL